MLGDEYGTASNIKSRVNRLSVLGAITSAQQRLKLYNKVCATAMLQLKFRAACYFQSMIQGWGPVMLSCFHAMRVDWWGLDSSREGSRGGEDGPGASRHGA